MKKKYKGIVLSTMPPPPFMEKKKKSNSKPIAQKWRSFNIEKSQYWTSQELGYQYITTEPELKTSCMERKNLPHSDTSVWWRGSQDRTSQVLKYRCIQDICCYCCPCEDLSVNYVWSQDALKLFDVDKMVFILVEHINPPSTTPCALPPSFPPSPGCRSWEISLP